MRKNEDTGPRACKRCGDLFTFTLSNPRGWQCQPCRTKIKNGGRKRGPYVARPDRPWAGANATHTKAWHDRSLGQSLASTLAQVWTQPQADYVTRD